MRGVVDEESIVELIAAAKCEIINTEKVDSVCRCGKIEQRVTPKGVAVTEELPTRCVIDCESRVHAGVDALGPALDQETLSLLCLEAEVVDGIAIGAAVQDDSHRQR